VYHRGVPKAEIRKRGGAVRVRTKTLPDGRRMKVYIVRDVGPRGGKTVAGEIEGEPNRRRR
jgi:hypothetical protein